MHRISMCLTGAVFMASLALPVHSDQPKERDIELSGANSKRENGFHTGVPRVAAFSLATKAGPAVVDKNPTVSNWSVAVEGKPPDRQPQK